jgi:eukaryotic-like serine/threonine-protein kinase
MTIRPLFACVFFACMGAALPLSAQEHAQDASPMEALAPTWTFETGGPIYSSPTLHGNSIYLGSGDGHLYSVEMETGIEQWRFETGGAVDSAPAVADGMVYAVSRDGSLHAVAADDGTLRWSFETGGERMLDFWDHYLSDPLVHGDLVVFGSGDGAIYALDRLSGDLQWSHETTQVVHAAPVVGDDLIYIGGFDGILYALRVETGEVAWQFETEGNPGFPRGDIQRAVALYDGVLYFGSRDYRLYALDAADGRVLWSLEESGGWIIATPLVTDDHVLFGASDGQRFYALDRSTGEVAWTIPVFTRVFGTAVLVGDDVVFGGFNGKLMGVDPESGKVRWTYQTPASKALFDAVFDEEGRLTDEMRALYEDGRGREAEERLLQMGSIAATPTVRGTMVYFGTTEGVLYALDAAGFAG